MLQPMILEKLEALPDPLKTEVLHYIEFLYKRYVSTETEPPNSQKKRGGLGLLKGKIRMADDFDAPLEDFKEYT
jgi:Protein of unknown function (DUF2281)